MLTSYFYEKSIPISDQKATDPDLFKIFKEDFYKIPKPILQELHPSIKDESSLIVGIPSFTETFARFFSSRAN